MRFVLVTWLLILASGVQPLRAAPAERCGTWMRLEVQAAPGATTQSRPAPGSIQLGSGHFIIHYEDAALDAYAQDVSDAAEKAWRVLVDTLGYDVPPSDAPAGGDGRIDVYLRPPAQMAGAWGLTTPEVFVGAPYDGTWTAYVEVVDTLSFDRRRVVTAHEFFHVIHLAYDRNESTSFFEMISTWAEDRVYDDVNLYLDVLPNFFSQPQRNLYSYVYSNVPWMIFLTENYGDGILRDIMDGCAATAGVNVSPATNAALAPYASSEIDELTRFTLWNYFTGARDDGLHYSEGASFPLVSVEKRSTCYPFYDFISIHKMGRLGANYFFFDGNGASDALRLRVLPQWDATSVFTVHRFKAGAVETEAFTTPPSTSSDSVTVADWAQCDSLLFICHVQSTSSSLNSVAVSAWSVPQAPPDEGWVLVLDRDACRRPFDGSGDEFSRRDGQERPVADAVAGLGIRVVQSDSIPSDLGLCGGVFVVGGHDGAATNLADAEMAALMTFMDGGGDVYVEGNELGRWIDPTQGGGSATAHAFWAYFGCDFIPGNPAAAGNVSSWQTPSTSAVGAMGFGYDFQGEPDDDVGILVPVTADTLAVDQGGDVRITLRTDAGSARIMSTVLLGGSTGIGGTRGDFVGAVIDLFDSIVASLSVQSMRIQRDGDRVRLDGELSGYGGESIRLSRMLGGAAVEVPVSVSGRGGRVLVEAVDEFVDAPVVYRLEASDDGGARARVLWQQAYDGRVPSAPLALTSVFPNPASGPVSVVVEADRPAAASIRVYNVAGQLVLTQRSSLVSGSNTIVIDDGARLGSGVYFVRVAARGLSAGRKFHILR